MEHAGAAYWTLLVGTPIALAVVVWRFPPPAAPMPDYLRDAVQYAATGHISDTTYPLAFAWLAGVALRVLGPGPGGWELLQAAFYVSAVVIVWALARRSGADLRASLGAGLLTALYPELGVSVAKFWDLEMSVWLMTVFMLLCLLLWQRGPRTLLIVLFGLAAGLAMAQRPNMALLMPLPAWLCLKAKATLQRRVAAIAGAGALAAATLVGINTAAHGSFFLSQNGPYNFVQGHNEFTVQTLLDDLSCEPSVGMILKADGMQSAGFNEADPALQVYFRRRAFAYIRSHPLGEVRITAVKLWTLFRPNTRLHHGVSVMTAAIVAPSLIFPVWIVLLAARWKRAGLDAVESLFLAATVLYALPFLITSSDPRYQVPLEVCMLAHIAAMLTRIRAVQPAAVQD